MPRLDTATNTFVTLTCLIVLGLAVGYCFGNPTGHGISPRIMLYGALPVLLTTLIGYRVTQRRHYQESILAAFLCILFAVLTPATYIMLDYEIWLNSGMPDPPAYRLPYLWAFTAASLGNFALLVRRWMKKA